MVGVIDTLVQLAPIVDFFMMLVVVVVVLYSSSLISSAYRRMGKVTVEADAIFQTLFGDILPQLEAAQNAMPEMANLVRNIQSLKDRVKATATTTTGGSQ